MMKLNKYFILLFSAFSFAIASCTKNESEPVKPLTIAKITPALKTEFTSAGQTITIEFSEKIVFSATNWQAYMKYWETEWKGNIPTIYFGGGYITPKQENTYLFDGNKTITIKMGTSFKAGVPIGWLFPVGSIKTPDGRELQDDDSGMGYWIDYTFKQ